MREGDYHWRRVYENTERLATGEKPAQADKAAAVSAKSAERRRFCLFPQKTEGETTSDGEAVSGDVFIGCGETEKTRFLLREAKRMNVDCPDVRFHLFSGREEVSRGTARQGARGFRALHRSGESR